MNKTNQQLAEKIRITPLRGNHEPINLPLSRASVRLLATLSEQTGLTAHQLIERSLLLYKSFPDVEYKDCQYGKRNDEFRRKMVQFFESVPTT